MILLLGLLPFFFFGGPGAQGSRSFIALWDLGHVGFFCLASLFGVDFLRSRVEKLSLQQIFFVVFLLVLVTGAGVEFLQKSFDGRTPDIWDIVRNQLGALIAFTLFVSGRGWQRVSVTILLACLLLIVVSPLLSAVIDEWRSSRQFPLLSDFETSFEVDRWVGSGKLVTVKGLSRHGHYALKVQLTTDKYSGVFLKYFQGDWKRFKKLFFSIYLPGAESLYIVCRVHDTAHDNRYSDRYNRAIVLKKGWNDIVIFLDEVANSPKERLLKLENVESFGCFVIEQEREMVLYLDSVYLE